MTPLLKAGGGLFYLAGILAGGAYFLLAVFGFGSLFGVWWALAAFVVPPIDLFYPFAVYAKLGAVPWAMVGLLIGAPLALGAGTLLGAAAEAWEGRRERRLRRQLPGTWDLWLEAERRAAERRPHEAGAEEDE